jgi:hypothetical protein
MKLRRSFVSLGLALALGMTLSGVSVAQAASPVAACATTWGSQPKVGQAEPPATGVIRNVRTGRHDCYDRLVVDLDAKPSGWSLQYVDQVYTSGSGELVPLRGGAKLLLTAFAPTYDVNGRPTYRPSNVNELVNVTGYQTFRQVALAGGFEGVSDFGLGVRARLPFRVLLVDDAGGSHLVVDVAHSW